MNNQCKFIIREWIKDFEAARIFNCEVCDLKINLLNRILKIDKIDKINSDIVSFVELCVSNLTLQDAIKEEAQIVLNHLKDFLFIELENDIIKISLHKK